MRVQWRELPATIHLAVEQTIGEPVIAAISQSSGFSTGSADRVRTGSGRTAFVKAAAGGQSAELHRREIAVLHALPVGVSAPRLLGHVDDGEWVALILEDVAGVHASSDDTNLVLSALAALPLAGKLAIPPAASGLGWTTPPALPGLEFLVEFARLAPAAMAGDHLVHLDLRCDNVLINAAQNAVIVDWPWASRGASWIDGLTFLLDLRRLEQGIDCEVVLAEHPFFASASQGDITCVLAGLALTFFDAARQESAVPGLAQFQRSEGQAALSWVLERIGDTVA